MFTSNCSIVNVIFVITEMLILHTSIRDTTTPFPHKGRQRPRGFPLEIQLKYSGYSVYAVQR